MTFRKGDRVLVQYPQNSLEPIVTSVIDGFAKRPALQRETGPTITLQLDESIKVKTNDGSLLLEIHKEETGPVVKSVRIFSFVSYKTKSVIDSIYFSKLYPRSNRQFIHEIQTSLLIKRRISFFNWG